MKIVKKFNIGDNVFYLDKHGIKKSHIIKIIIVIFEKGIHVLYDVLEESNIPERCLFKNKEELNKWVRRLEE